MAKIKIILTEKKEREIDVTFPMYRKQHSSDSVTYTKVFNENTAIDIKIHHSKEGFEKFEFEIYKPYFSEEAIDFLLGEQEYICTEEVFIQQLEYVKHMLSIEKIVS